MNVVKYNWVERGGKGFVEVNFFYGESEEPEYAFFHLDHAQAMSLVMALGKALEAGLGERESNGKLMEREIAIQFSDMDIILSRPCECRLIARENDEVQVVSRTGQRAFLFCASEAAAERVVEKLRDNSLTDLRLDDEIVKITFHAADEIFATGLSDDEIAEMNRDYERVSLDCWRKR